MKLKFENKEIELVDIWFRYLYPYVLRFCIKKNINREWKNDIIYIPKENQSEFNQYLKLILKELLCECYTEPTQKDRSKHSSRFQKINLENRTYILNYRTDVVGIVGYALNYLIIETTLDN